MLQHSSLNQIARGKKLRALLRERHRERHILAVSAMLAGALITLGACLYRRVWHPEWVGGQALQALWPFYIAAALSLYFGWRLSDAGSK
jgi:hypothetical protein